VLGELFSPQRRGTLTVIWALAWPTMLEQLLQTTVQYIDTAMVGALGTTATAAVGSTTTVNWLVMGSVGAMGVGFLAYIAKALGAHDEQGARRASAQAVLAVLGMGLLYTVITLSLSPFIPTWMRVDAPLREISSTYFAILYIPMLPRAATAIFGTVLRAAGDTKTPLKVGIAVNVINIVLNFFLIFPTREVSVLSYEFTIIGADMGVIGAAVASAVAFLVGGVAITVAIFRHPLVSPRGQSFRPDITIWRPCLRVALPNMLQNFVTSMGYVTFAGMVNSLGEISTAAHNIANTVESLFYIPGYGMKTAAATLAGNAYGARNGQRMREIARTLVPIEIILMVISGAALFAFAPALMGLFSKDETVIALGATVLRMVALSEPLFGFSIIVEGLMQGVGQTKTPFLYNMIGMWGIRIVGTFLCVGVCDMTLVAAWACMISHNVFLFLLFLINYLRGSWNPLRDM
jgi:putative MATE family efflux protein